MRRDAQGHALSGATSASAALFDQGVRALNLYHGDPQALIDAARRHAPDFTMAHVTAAWMLVLPSDPTLDHEIATLLAHINRLPRNEREQAHFAALAHAASRARRAAIATLDRHLMEFPHDILAHHAAHVLEIHHGRPQLARERCLRAVPFWTPDMPGYATLLAFQAFGLQESGDHAQAEAVATHSLDLEPFGFFPHHTISHCLEMTDRAEEGVRWTDSSRNFWSAPESGARAHMWWHKSLFHIEIGQLDTALALYDGPLMESLSPLGTGLCDPAAVLWRLDLLGCDVGTRWQDQLPLWHNHADSRCLAFTDTHATMAELRSGHEHLVEQRLTRMRATAATNFEGAAIYGEVAIPLIQGLMAFHTGAYARAVDLLLPIRADLWKIGGSIAQRDLIDWTLTEAAIRGSITHVAQAMCHERTAQKPRSGVNRGLGARLKAGKAGLRPNP